LKALKSSSKPYRICKRQFLNTFLLNQVISAYALFFKAFIIIVDGKSQDRNVVTIKIRNFPKNKDFNLQPWINFL